MADANVSEPASTDAKKSFSAGDVLQAWAEQLGKLPTEFGLQSFENKDGEFSVVLVNLQTKSLVAQANGADEQACLDRLGNNVAVTHLDEFVAPKEGGDISNSATAIGYGTVDTKTHSDVKDIPAQENVETVKTNQDVIDNFPKNDNGQVVINEDGAIEGLPADQQPQPANVANTQAENDVAKADAAKA